MRNVAITHDLYVVFSNYEFFGYGITIRSIFPFMPDDIMKNGSTNCKLSGVQTHLAIFKVYHSFALFTMAALESKLKEKEDEKKNTLYSNKFQSNSLFSLFETE